MKIHTFSIAAALVFVAAQAQQTTPPAEPSTSQTEGTAADRTRPGQTPTQDAPRQTVDPAPATRQSEGTAADRTPPGSTSNTQGTAAQRGSQRSEIVGAPVVSAADAQLGEVVDVVFDAANRPEFVVIQSEGKAMAMPYSAASAMKKENKIVVDESRLQAAPKVEEGAWRNPASSRWRQESTRYWGRG
jgi:hypothetical protein